MQATPPRPVTLDEALRAPGPERIQLTVWDSIGSPSTSVTSTHRFVRPPGARIWFTGGENVYCSPKPSSALVRLTALVLSAPATTRLSPRPSMVADRPR